jgi:tRNA threonylcarbamoyladenosine biosynthesis protein TsaB
LWRDAAPLATACWTTRREPPHRPFTVLPELLAEAGVEARDIEQAVVGTGPGSFAGIRIALALANGLTLPGNVPVNGLPSSEPLAWDALGETDWNTVAVIGDARRQRLWIARYRRRPGGLEILCHPNLIPATQLGTALTNVDGVATPDWDRIAGLLVPAAGPSTALLRENRSPHASSLAALAERRLASGASLPPPVPLYLHAAV